VVEIAVSTDGGPKPGLRRNSWTLCDGNAWRRWIIRLAYTERTGAVHVAGPRQRIRGGLIQPDSHDQNYGTYVINHSLPIEVFVDHFGGPAIVTPVKIFQTLLLPA